MTGYICITTIDDNYTKTVKPEFCKEDWQMHNAFSDFMEDNIMKDESLVDYVDKIINDDCHNLITTDSFKLCEMVYNEIENFTDMVVTGETAYIEGTAELVYHIRFDNEDGYADFSVYKVNY